MAVSQSDPHPPRGDAANPFAALLRLLEENHGRTTAPAPEISGEEISGEEISGDEISGAATARYEALRHRLIRYLTWERCLDPELLADEAFSRMARRIANGERIDSPAAYLFGIARVLRREEATRRSRESAALEELAARTSMSAYLEGPGESRDARECLAGCLKQLTVAQRDFILRYYQGDQGQRIRNRKEMAAEEGLDLNALRNRALRLRGKLEHCTRDCLNRMETS